MCGGNGTQRFYQIYRKIKKNQATEKQLFKIMVYISMNQSYSRKNIETACHRDINFMYLLEGNPIPDYATFALFISLHFAQYSKKTLAEVSELLYSLGEISGKSLTSYLKKATKKKLWRIKQEEEIAAAIGYGSEENYLFLEENG